jgi:predicted dithiol-disulfide oxidoreductase (DUF899 family)
MNSSTSSSRHRVASREEWFAARRDLLHAEKELTRRSDEVAQQRRALPWVPLEKEYEFETEEGNASPKDFFKGRSQLLIYHFIDGPDGVVITPIPLMRADSTRSGVCISGSIAPPKGATSTTSAENSSRCRGVSCWSMEAGDERRNE